jgi:hypothetical protein
MHVRFDQEDVNVRLRGAGRTPTGSEGARMRDEDDGFSSGET